MSTATERSLSTAKIHMGSGTRHCFNWRVLIMPRLTAEFFTDDAVDTPYWWEAAKPSPISADEVT
ncbi:MAG: hypothetical protein E5X61_03230 [Mesorhizobium sp.]|nr:MAG: hypothetical protein E5X61_03230 [Mesorhizobium sp.]